jgi:hypothetical protein
MPINLNTAPYFDDFDASKNFHKILFVPGRPIQSRELTQIQTLLQHQVKLHGDYVFKNGAMVIPGNINYINNILYVRLNPVYSGVFADTLIESMVGKVVVGETTNVKATIIHAEKSTSDDAATVFINYTSGGVVSGTYYKEFEKDEVLHLEADANIKVQIENSPSYTGMGSGASVEEGVYYINGYFVQNTKQILILDKYNSQPTYRVGLEFVDSIVSALDDPSLNDNAIGSTNYSAPGADRYQIVLTLAKRPLFASQEDQNTTDTQFIDLLHVKNGEIQFKINRTELGEFEKTLARRTYDESGDYVVNPFKYEIHEYRNNNRGTWVTGTTYIQNDIVSYVVGAKTQYFVALTSSVSGASVPSVTSGEFNDGGIVWLATNTPNFNTGFHTTTDESLDQQLSDSTLGIIKVSDGKAYIKGFEVDVVGYRTIVFDKSREFKRVQNAVINSDVGSYLIVDNVYGLPPISYIDSGNKPLDLVTIKDAAGTNVGTCRVRSIEYLQGTIGQATCQYKVYLFDIVINSGKTFAADAKKLAISTTFAATVVGTRKVLSGSVKTTGSSTTLTGDGTLFTIELSVGDSIVISGIVYRVATITNAVSMTIDRAVDLANYTAYYKEQTTLSGTKSLVNAMPNRFIRSLRTANDDTINASYYVKRVFQATSSGTGVLNLYVTNSGESFAPILSSNYQASLANGSGLVIPITATLLASNTNLNITGLANSTSYRIITTVKKETLSSKEKQKIRNVKVVTLTSVNTVDRAFIQLSEADCVNLVSVTQSGGTLFDFNDRAAVVSYTEAGETDITQYYKLDSGQTPYYYGLGKVIPQNSFVPSAPVKVTYEYYDHTDGDYFSVNSFGVPYDMLPVIDGASASDYLDFRPRIADTGADFDQSAGASLTEPMSYFYQFSTDYSYYLPRRDILQVDSSGRFRVEQGTPSDTPLSPIANDDNVILAYIDVSPYTYKANSSNVRLTVNPLRRYTMKDIGSIDNRLGNVEYYTALNTLEKQTKDLQIVDEFGLDRYKNGFIVDQFKDHGIGNVTNPDYKCAIDESTQECRAPFDSKDVKLLEQAGQSRVANNYQVTGDIVTLPYTHVSLIEQKVATSSEFVTPYTHIRSMTGDLKVFPASDTWVDTETLPDAIQQSEGNLAAITAMARATGVIGTIWNSWQEVARSTIASSTSTTTTSQTSGWWRNQIRTDTTTTNLNGVDLVTNQRVGTETFVQEQWDEVGRVTGVVDQKWTPFMRQKAIVLYSKKMMPLTMFDTYVENFNLSEFITPASTIRFSGKVGTFLDYNQSNINHADIAARQFGTNDYDLLDRGEVIKGRTSDASAIAVCEEVQFTNGSVETVLKVLNVKGTFTVGEVVVGQSSAATFTFVSLTNETLQATNSAGSFYGVLMLPNTPQIRIPAGIITISLRDNDVVEDITTKAETSYNGQGLVQVKQTTIMSVRNGVIAQRNTVQEDQTTQNWSRIVARSATSRVVNCNCNCGDPLAQTFKHDDVGGVFVTKIDLYFHSVDQDPSTGVVFQIREVINGYPGPAVVPFSQVTKYPNEIVSSRTSLVATTFNFESPVYLQNGTEYCFVVASENSNTKVWVSKMGEVGLDGQAVTRQPNMGSFFRSQNNNTWDADQLSDMCFTLYKAKFNIASYGHIALANNNVESKQLEVHPFKFNIGSTSARVAHRNHGLTNGDHVTFSGVVSTLTNPTANVLNGQFTVSNADVDSYIITLPVAATNSGWFGGTTVKATQNYKTDVMYLNGNDFVLPSTHINYTYRTTQKVSNAMVKSVVDYPVQIKRNVFFDNSQYVLSAENSVKYLAGDKSILIDAYLYSDNENVSPVIDLSSYSIHTVSNRINDPVSTSLNIDTNIILNNVAPLGNVVFNSAGYFSITDINKFDEFSALRVGCYVQFTAGSTLNTGKLLVTRTETDKSTYFRIYTSDAVVTETTSVPVTLKQYENYISPIAPDETSNLFNYITKIVELSKQSNGFKLLFEYNQPIESNIDVYYKVSLKSSFSDIEKMVWTKLEDVTFISDPNRSKFVEKEIDVATIAFDQITVKLVSRSSDTTRVPKFKSFRLIALA